MFPAKALSLEGWVNIYSMNFLKLKRQAFTLGYDIEELVLQTDNKSTNYTQPALFLLIIQLSSTFKLTQHPIIL